MTTTLDRAPAPAPRDPAVAPTPSDMTAPGHADTRRVRLSLASLTAMVMLAACSWGDNSAPPPVGPPPDVNVKPTWVGTVTSTHYDGTTDDLLTAGLGATGMASPVPPTLSTPPTAAELRRLAIYTNYRALLDMTTAGGYGVYYGPGVAADGSPAPNDGKIAGTEEIAFTDDGTGRVNVTLAVQIPDNFDPANACIVTATSSGSRGVYGAMSTAEWGLKHGCAVALTDKGTGGAPHDLQADTVPLIDGTRAPRASAPASAVHFSAGLSDSELATFDAAWPDRFAFKHAHSQQNPEKDWGTWTLQAVEFAFWRLNEKYGTTQADGTKLRTILAGNTIVIASSASNGGGAAIAAAELDQRHLIDGVAVSEPAVELPASPGVSVQRGSTTIATFGKPLIDFTTVANLYQSCASQSAQVAGTPGVAYVIPSFAANRCAALHAQGFLAATTPAAQADEALQKLRDYGWEPESDVLHASLAAFEVAPAVAVTFANAYSRAKVSDRLCGFSYAATTSAGAVTPLAQAALDPMWATGNGVPPAGGIQLVNDDSLGGPARALLSVSPTSGTFDFDLDGATCLRRLVTGNDAAALALQAGVDETRRSGNLHGLPAIIVHGRSDALLPVNHTSRPYTALNKVVEGSGSQLSYIEVTNAQHFDAFIGLPTILPGYDSRYVPLHVYLERALDAMYAHLKTGAPLPASQVVRTVPRGGTPGAAPALTDANLPAIATTPAAGDAITMNGSTLVVPD